MNWKQPSRSSGHASAPSGMIRENNFRITAETQRRRAIFPLFSRRLGVSAVNNPEIGFENHYRFGEVGADVSRLLQEIY